MTLERDESRLEDMLQHAEEAVRFAAGRTRADLDLDRQLNLSLVRLLEIIGEAAAHVTPATRKQHPGIPWPQIVGLRNQLIHAYSTVDFDILWDIIRIDLPPLIAQLSVLAGDPLTRGLTSAFLRAHPEPYRAASEYAWEYFLKHGDDSLSVLPAGLQQLIAIVRLDDGIGGEGFRGHLGNVTTDEGEVEKSLGEAVAALRVFGATDAVQIATAALDEWNSRLPGWQSARERGDDPDFDGFEALADRLDKQWHAQQSAMYAAIDAYITAHSDEFVHP
jgi:uncharacterized protein with HEPN domain